MGSTRPRARAASRSTGHMLRAKRASCTDCTGPPVAPQIPILQRWGLDRPGARGGGGRAGCYPAVDFKLPKPTYGGMYFVHRLSKECPSTNRKSLFHAARKTTEFKKIYLRLLVQDFINETIGKNRAIIERVISSEILGIIASIVIN